MPQLRLTCAPPSLLHFNEMRDLYSRLGAALSRLPEPENEDMATFLGNLVTRCAEYASRADMDRITNESAVSGLRADYALLVSRVPVDFEQPELYNEIERTLKEMGGSFELRGFNNP